MKIAAADLVKGMGQGLGCAVATGIDPALHRFHTLVTHGGESGVTQPAQFGGVKIRGFAEGFKQRLAVRFGPVAPGEGLEHLHHSHCEEGIGLEAPLVTEQMQFHQQLVHHPPVERSDHMGEGGVEGTLAVGNGLGGAHAAGRTGEATLAPPAAVAAAR